MAVFLVYDRHTSIYLAIGYAKRNILDMLKVPRSHKIDPAAKRVKQLAVAMDGLTRIENGRLLVDAFGITDIAAWLYQSRKWRSDKAFGHAFDAMFPGVIGFEDVRNAALRLALGLEHGAHGSARYDVEEGFAAHSDEFNELRAERNLPAFRSVRRNPPS